jgi:hypothetical protein
MTLNSKIASLAETFASSVLAAIRSASLEEILAEGKGSRSTSFTAASSHVSAASPAKRGPGRPRKIQVTAPAPAPAKTGKGGRLARRSESDIQHVVGLIVSKLGEHKAGLRSEQIQKALKLDKKEITGPLLLALSSKKIVKTGQKRSTTYFAK